MLRFDTTIDTKAAQEFLGAAAAQLPKRTGFAMNTTANEIQKGVRARIAASRFVLRQPAFVNRTIYRKPREDFPDIKAGRFEAGVRIDDRRDFLAKHEAGGVKSEEGGGLRAGGRILVPVFRTVEPRRLIRRSSPLHIGKIPQGIFNPKTRPKGTRFFGIVSRRGVPLILQSTGRRGVRENKVVYALVRSVPIRPTLHFYATAATTFAREWPLTMQRELDEAVRRAEQKRTD